VRQHVVLQIDAKGRLDLAERDGLDHPGARRQRADVAVGDREPRTRG
jgi:hypothetical protein